MSDVEKSFPGQAVPNDGWAMNNVVDGAQMRGDIAPGIHTPKKPTSVRVDRTGKKATLFNGEHSRRDVEDRMEGEWEDIDIDSLIRVTEEPVGPGWTSGAIQRALRESPAGKKYPVLTRFLPKSERFYEHIMLECEKQESISDWVMQLLKQRDRVTGNRDGFIVEHLETIRETRIVTSVMRDERCKRVIMDARQAATFSEVGEAPPSDWQSRLRMPFDWFYLEFSDPVMIGEQELIPHTEATKNLKIGDDYVRAMLIRGAAVNVQTPDKKERGLCNVIVFLTDEAGHHTRRAFLYDMTRGKAMTRVKSLNANHSVIEAVEDDETKLGASAVETEKWEYDNSEIPQEFLDKLGGSAGEQFITVGEPYGIEDRYLGWWERILMSYSSLLSWLLTYMMSKGIEITEERLPRAMRRREMRKDIPKPWHIVQVEPRFRTDGNDESMPGQQRFTHNIRYDVMGHLRCIQKKNEDGTTSNSFVWVRPHQRGLANDIYVPKTASFKAGKETHPVMNSYFTPQK